MRPMHAPRRWLLACAAAVLCVTGCARQADDGEARKQIQQLLDTYFRSVNAADVTLAATIWLQSPDIVVVTPLGRTEGWDSVQRDIYVNFLQKAFLERDLRPSLLTLRDGAVQRYAAGLAGLAEICRSVR